MARHRPKPPVVAPETWRKLLEAAAAFQRKAPWEYMFDDEILGITDPVAGEVRLATIVGNLRQMFGVLIYRGEQGVRSLLTLLESGEEVSHDPDYGCEVDYLKLEFCLKRELSKEDLAILSQVGYCPPKKSGPVWPTFASGRPGYYPWGLTQTEAEVLLGDLRKVMEFAALNGPEVDLFEGRAADEFPFYPADPAYVGPLRVEDLQWRKVDYPPPPPVAPISLEGEAAKQLTSLQVEPSLTVELGVRYSSFVIGEGDRPYVAKLAVLLDGNGRSIYGFKMGPPSKSLEQVAGECLVETAQKLGRLPGVVRVDRESLNQALSELAEAGGFQVKQVPVLPAFEWAFEELTRTVR